MDVRDTAIGPETFLMAFCEYQENHNPVSLLLDQDGLSRVEGFVVAIHAEDPLAKTRIELDNGRSFFLADVIAVNGLFRSDYSEC